VSRENLFLAILAGIAKSVKDEVTESILRGLKGAEHVFICTSMHFGAGIFQH